MPSDSGRSARFARPSPPTDTRPEAGRAPAQRARRPESRRSKVSATAMVMLGVLLIAPAGALLKVSDLVGWRIVVIYAFFILFLTWTLYRRDKQQAECGGWRTPEASIHAAEVFGGWPAAFLAQRLYRHKIAKRNYQVNFWAIVLLHQCLAIEYVQEWRWTRAAWARLEAARLAQ